MNPPILLATLNATYFHCALGLRYLRANLRELEASSRLVEFTINESTRDIAEKILAMEPAIIGFGVYVWNVRQTEEVISIIKRVAPAILVVLGGPEVSHESERQAICQLADCTIRGEGEDLFYSLCRDYLKSKGNPTLRLKLASASGASLLAGPLPAIDALALPYRLYSDEDIAHRVLYVEASRGCPYKCEFCLSALDEEVRNFPLEKFLAEMDGLIVRGARQFKFVDRTFNLSIKTCVAILQFFLARIELGLFLHFELVPDRLPDELRVWLTKFPPGAVQFEVGIQTWSPEVSRRISRRQNYDKIRDNLTFLRNETGIHIHSDLIVGLPGETMESFGRGFDALAALAPHEIQVGLLKRLNGAPIARHDAEWGMVYQEGPPYTILRTSTLSFGDVQRMIRFAKFWDYYANKGNFGGTLELLRELSSTRSPPSLFDEMMQLGEFLTPRHPHLHSISLVNLVESAWCYLTAERGVPEDRARAVLAADYLTPTGREIPSFMKGLQLPRKMALRKDGLPPRQRRHVERAGNS